MLFVWESIKPNHALTESVKIVDPSINFVAKPYNVRVGFVKFSGFPRVSTIYEPKKYMQMQNVVYYKP